MTSFSPAVAMMIAAGPAAAATPATVAPLIVQPSLNVFRRFPDGELPRMVDYYARVLALTPHQTIDLGREQVLTYRIGTGQLKLAAGLKPGRTYHPGGPAEGTGIRLYTLFFADEAALAARFAAHGLSAPVFTEAGGRRAALVRDPAGFTLQLVIVPPHETGRVEIGIAAADLAATRAFYRDFVGLKELPPVRDALLGVTLHPFRAGSTTINVWQATAGVPADTGSGGMQYIVRNVDAVDMLGKARDVAVETPLGGVPGFNVRTVWLNDPGGVTNYFIQLMASPR